MFILIAGITGNLGQKLAKSLLQRGHAVRGLGRNPSKLDDTLRGSLDGFATIQTYHDIDVLDAACQIVDGVICAYNAVPELQLEGQLLLFRAAERAGVSRFVAASWNYDWRDMQLGQQESYDPYISFRRHVEISSSLKPIYIFTGVLAEVLFSVEGHGDFSPANHGVWDPERKEMQMWGPEGRLWYWTTEQDAAEFTAAIIERDDADAGGFWSVCSGANTLTEIASTYQEVRKRNVSIVIKGSEDDLRSQALKARAEGQPNDCWGYIGWFYQLHTVDGTWSLRCLDNAKLDVETTTLADFLEAHPEI